MNKNSLPFFAGNIVLIKKKRKFKINHASRNVFLIILFLSVILLIPASFETNFISGVTKAETYEAITQAFVKIEEASKEGINVTEYVSKINSAIQDYNDGLYTEAYDKANEIIAELIDLIASFKTGKLFPYILIPFNVVCIAALVVSLVRNIRNRTTKEYVDEPLNQSDDNIINE